MAGMGWRGGERARVAARVRALLADPANPPTGTGGPRPGWLPDVNLSAPAGPATMDAEDAAQLVPPTGAEAQAPSPPGPEPRFGWSFDRGQGGRHHRSGWPKAESGAVPRIRLDAGRRGVVAVGLALLLVAAATAWWVFLGRPRASAVPVITSARGSVASTSAAAARPGSVPASVVVDVVGKVKRPGVYRLHPGARVEDAVQAAGGTTAGADLSSTNLARKLVDGEQIAVGLAPAQAPGTTGSSAGVTGSGGLIDLNTATAEQLDALPGVGPVLAQHILDWRSAHGRFDSADQLREVSGIGPSKFADLRPLVTV
jgi:competence protein ComEA